MNITQEQDNSRRPTEEKYLLEYTDSGKLVREDFRDYMRAFKRVSALEKQGIKVNFYKMTKLN